MSFGERLIEVLDSQHMTRADLCRLTGLTSGHLTPYIKNPDRSPTLSTACRIALALDVSLDYLAGIIDEPEPIRRDALGRPTYPDARQERINAQYEDMNERGQARAADSVDDIHANPKNLKSGAEAGVTERSA